MYRGLYAPDTPVAFQCPTGHCTWTPFSTLGLCSSCTNVSESISKTCSVHHGALGKLNLDSVISINDLPGVTCTYVTPKNSTLQASFNSGPSTTFNSTITWQYYPDQPMALPNTALIRFRPNFTHTVVNHYEEWMNGSRLGLLVPEAFECSFH